MKRKSLVLHLLPALMISFMFASHAVGGPGQTTHPGPGIDALMKEIHSETYQELLEYLSGARDFLNGVRISDRYRQGNLKNVHELIRWWLNKNGFSNVQEDKFTVVTRKENGRNFWVDIPGKSSRANEIILVSAHYDTTYKGRPGANDNASGVAAVLAMAAAYKKLGLQPERTIRFVLFDSEELAHPMGKSVFLGFAKGSKVYFDRAMKKGEQVALMLNMDMIAYSPGGHKHVMYDPGSNVQIIKLLQAANTRARLNFEFEAWSGHWSDQRMAWNHNIPAVSIFENPRTMDGKETADYPFYHSEADTIDKLNIPYATEITRLVAASAFEAARIDKWKSKFPEVKYDVGMESRPDLDRFLNGPYDKVPEGGLKPLLPKKPIITAEEKVKQRTKILEKIKQYYNGKREKRADVRRVLGK